MGASVRYFWYAFAGILLWIGVGSYCCGEDLAAAVVAKFKEREAQWNKACISWDFSLHQQVPAENPKAPPSNTATSFQASLIILGNKYRYTRRTFRTHADGSVALVPHTTSFDGGDNYMFSDRSRGSPAIGRIEKGDHFRNLNPPSLPLEAPSLIFRPFASGLLPKGSQPRSDGVDRELEGRTCRRVSFPKGPNLWTHVWIDKDSFLPFRLEGERDGATESVLNLRYRGAPAVETLSEWDYTAYLYGSGTVLEAGSARKVQVDVDCDTSDSVFRIAYPPGTLVDDKRSGRWVHLVATADGSLKPRSAVLQPKPVVGKWIIVTAVALVIFSIMIVVFRRLRK